MSTLIIILALCGGALLSIQAAINGRLGSQVGVFRSAFLTFATGALVTGLLILFFAPATSVTLLRCLSGSCWALFCVCPTSSLWCWRCSG